MEGMANCVTVLFQDRLDHQTIDCQATGRAAKSKAYGGCLLFLLEGGSGSITERMGRNLCDTFKIEEGSVATEQFLRKYSGDVVHVTEARLGKQGLKQTLERLYDVARGREVEFDTPLFAMYGGNESKLYLCNIIALGK